MCSPSYRSGNDVIVHLLWNAPHKRGGKQSGDVDWSIITKPHPLSTQEARLRLQNIYNVMSYLTIHILGVTAKHDSSALMNLKGKPQQRGLIRQGKWVRVTMAIEAAMQAHDTLPQGVESIRALL